MKEYPNYTDFDIDDVIYGVSAPFVGIGVYTTDRKFSWPDLEGTTRKEYDSWVKHLNEHGYSVPEKYLNAFVELQI